MKTLKRIASIVMMTAIGIVGMTSCDKGGDDNGTKADYTAINTLISQVETILGSATTADYPQANITALSTLLNTTKAAVQAGNLTQSQVDNLRTALQAELNTFNASKYEDIPATALLISLDFDGAEADAITTGGTKSLTATLTAGPSDIFTDGTAKPTYVDGVKGGKAIHFEKGSHLQIADYTVSDFLQNQMSWAAWVKPAEARAGNIIMSLNYWNNWKFQIQDGGKLFLTVKSTVGATDMDNESDNSVPVNSWTHVVATMDFATHTVNLYVNGTLTKTWTSTEKPNLSGSLAPAYESTVGKLPLMIGTNTTYAEATAAFDWEGWNTPASWDYFNGDMDNVAVYSAALSAGQVAKLYNSQKPE